MISAEPPVILNRDEDVVKDLTTVTILDAATASKRHAFVRSLAPLRMTT